MEMSISFTLFVVCCLLARPSFSTQENTNNSSTLKYSGNPLLQLREVNDEGSSSGEEWLSRVVGAGQEIDIDGESSGDDDDDDDEASGAAASGSGSGDGPAITSAPSLTGDKNGGATTSDSTISAASREPFGAKTTAKSESSATLVSAHTANDVLPPTSSNRLVTDMSNEINDEDSNVQSVGNETNDVKYPLSKYSSSGDNGAESKRRKNKVHFTVIIILGSIGSAMLLMILVAAILYKIKKKDEGSYTLDEKPPDEMYKTQDVPKYTPPKEKDACLV